MFGFFRHPLSINRNSLVIPNPRGDRELLPGDVLLCYGKQDTLRDVMRPTIEEKKKVQKERKAKRKKSPKNS